MTRTYNNSIFLFISKIYFLRFNIIHLFIIFLLLIVVNLLLVHHIENLKTIDKIFEDLLKELMIDCELREILLLVDQMNMLLLIL